MTKQFSPHPGSSQAGGLHDDHVRDASRQVRATRIIALGSAVLMDGFRLAGVEVISDATGEQLEALLKTLVSVKEKALVLVEAGLVDKPGPWLYRVQSEGGRVVVVQVPPLARAADYHLEVDRLIGQSMAGAME
jgi:vacuolar-type H+-ATPase subunit F/Vma7